MRAIWITLSLLAAGLVGAAVRAEDPVARVDALLAEHWKIERIEPAAEAAPHELARRLMLDLTGRVPTADEAEALVAELKSRGTPAVAEKLIAGPEFPLHFARLIDDCVQQRQAGDEAFVEWLRRGMAEGKSWEAIFRGILVGPWDSDADKPANRFLLKRVKNLDSLTADASRAFFGVDITCARCHDHPLVSDWTQDHYYGLASFFNRTNEASKGSIGEKNEGEVTFEARLGGQKTAQMMFLSGETFVTAAKQQRREQLVIAALAERKFLSRAMVNRAWSWLLGRGLVDPVDQMHSENAASIPPVLDFLAADFADHDYDLRHLARTIASCRAYRLSSRVVAAAPPAGSFAAGRLKPLSPRQFALSLVLATGEPAFAADDSPAARGDKYRALEKRAGELLAGLDPVQEGYQASAGEALFLANHPAVHQLTQPAGNNLAARLLQAADDQHRIAAAYRAVLGREPAADEREGAKELLDKAETREDGVSDLVWALVTSAEFRFCP
ncbi:MAG: DUF1553 domain-containing protein [Pirellulaceae bacterium]|nr:DUF1553 domain-containing protein [Pirellulaceae bacterium]